MRHDLPYHHDSAELFAVFAQKPWAMLLDSGQLLNPLTGKPGSQYGRYDILVADPFMTFVTQGQETEISHHGVSRVSREDPFQLLNDALGKYKVATTLLPFSGGAVGYFSYDLARRIELFSDDMKTNDVIPQMMVGIYDWAVIVDHREKTACLVSRGLDAQTNENWSALCTLFEQTVALTLKGNFSVTSEISSNLSKEDYAHAFAKVKHYIQEGDCYQVNLAQRFSVQAHGDGWAAYQKLREISPAPFMAYMRLPQVEILSASPERFLQVLDGHVETRPIKGTRPRADDPIEDANNAKLLEASLKDRAENLMIVDLLRNDIGKNCEIGSIKADKLFQLQSFANVHHLVSIVSGKLATNKTALDLLRGCFPGGSITGAPKLRAMQIIEELEPDRRAVYCGSIGYIGFDGNMDTNIAIRTAIYTQGEISFYAGGGVVADSTMEKEYKETLDKASSMMMLVRYYQQGA